MTPTQRARVRGLSPSTKEAVLAAVLEWVDIAQREGYAPITGWQNFAQEVWHSALLRRLFDGDQPYVNKPPTAYSYPDYDYMVEFDEELAP